MKRKAGTLAVLGTLGLLLGRLLLGGGAEARIVAIEIRSQEPLLGTMVIGGFYVGYTYFNLGLVELIGVVWLLRRISNGRGRGEKRGKPAPNRSTS